MSTNNNAQEEVDLGVLFAGIKRFFKHVLVLLYSFIQFIIRSWAVLLALLVIGVAAGYFLKKENDPTKAVLIVQLNYNSYPYVYDAVELLNNPIEGATDERGEKNLPEVSEIEIEPIVNINELLDGFEDYERNAVLSLLLDLREQEGLYSADAFMGQYRFHKIEVVFPPGANQQSIDNLIAYLGDNHLMQDIKRIGFENFQQKIEDNKTMVRQIDDVLTKISGTSGDVSSPNLLVLGGSDENSSVSAILELKKELLEENDNLRETLPTKEELVVLFNQPRLIKHTSPLSNKMILLPILLIGFYLLISALRAFYLEMKRIAINQ